MNRRHLLLFVLFFSLVVAFPSCKRKGAPVEVAKPKVSKSQAKSAESAEFSILRYEQDLFSIDQKNIAAGVAALYGKYPENLIQKGSWENREMLGFLLDYLNDPVIRKLYDDTQAQFADMSDFRQRVTAAMSLYQAHFPGARLPDFCTLISGLDFDMPSVFGYENTIFIALDMYLGKDYRQYSQAGMPKYVAARCEPKYMPTDCFTKALVYRHLPDQTLITLLDNMVDAGKKVMFTQTMFPSVSEQDILGYTKEQFQWAQKHESAVWHYFVEKNMLYGRDDDVARRMIDETPFTRDFGNASPGRLGWYMGYQIVKAYMKSHPGTTLNELMKTTDSQKLLKESGYKPK
ncbi:MAG: DUF2268 domain-containing putative Zn-dependent protease [Bacteroidales bacterium]|nr:DUF2268 domain-containing putative Zn-dependent protease [Bacteroidales bacterium]MDY6347765.1 DUF2268 domain-containing putative Zn-dependent protease [Bacteroidales bacterium]